MGDEVLKPEDPGKAVRRYNLGRPRRYKTPEEITVQAQEYFESCYDEKGNMLYPISITGLCNYLGTTRKQLSDYETGSLESLKDGSGDDEAFRSAIKRVKHICEQFAEEHGFSARNPAFAIFALKNYGWKDTQTIETTTTEIHTIDPELRQLATDYMKQLVAQQKGLVIDVTPSKLLEMAEATPHGSGCPSEISRKVP